MNDADSWKSCEGTKRTTVDASPFSTTADDADLSEREDEDIYTHYIEQMRMAKLE